MSKNGGKYVENRDYLANAMQNHVNSGVFGLVDCSCHIIDDFSL